MGEIDIVFCHKYHIATKRACAGFVSCDGICDNRMMMSGCLTLKNVDASITRLYTLAVPKSLLGNTHQKTIACTNVYSVPAPAPITPPIESMLCWICAAVFEVVP